MNLQELKQKALELKNKAVDYWSNKLIESGFTLEKKEEINDFIQKSENTELTDKETWETKHYIKKAILIFGEEKTDFFKKALFILPILATKGFSQNIPVKLVKCTEKNIWLDDYKIKELPSLIVFENKVISQLISGEENILKLVKKLELDINKAIDEL